MQTKHTPGPWVIGGSLISNGRTPVALVLHNGNGNPSKASDYDRDAPRWVDGADANAALIAAAPELLAALRHLLEDAVALNMGESDRSGVLAEARAAIAKATGGQS
jgi:hypothetical protein